MSAKPYRSITAQSLHYYSRPHSVVPDKPLTTPAAWYGRDLRDSNEWCQHFTTAQVAEFRAAIDAAKATGKSTEALTAADFPLPGLTAAVADWRRELQSGRGFLLLRGLPVTQWSEADCEVFFWCLGWHLGLPGAQNRFGELLGHVRDTGADPQNPTVREYRTRVNIGFHCDAADVVGLMCLSTAKSGGASRIASSVTIFNELLRQDPQRVRRLFQPFVMDAHAEAGLQYFPVTPCRYYDGSLRTFYHSGYFRSASRYPDVAPLTPEERQLLDAYDRLASDPDIHLDMELAPGDIQLCSNHSIVHSRTAYEDYPEPEKRRHLLRLWLSLPERQSPAFRLRKAASQLALAATLLRCRWRQRGRFSPEALQE